MPLYPSGYSSRLLKKADQCRAAYVCSHLFWTEDVKDSENVLLCLKRSLKIANKAQEMASAAHAESVSSTLFVEVLNKYLYFFSDGNEVRTRRSTMQPPRAGERVKEHVSFCQPPSVPVAVLLMSLLYFILSTALRRSFHAASSSDAKS